MIGSDFMLNYCLCDFLSHIYCKGKLNLSNRQIESSEELNHNFFEDIYPQKKVDSSIDLVFDTLKELVADKFKMDTQLPDKT
jgi:hypothetical protein